MSEAVARYWVHRCQRGEVAKPGSPCAALLWQAKELERLLEWRNVPAPVQARLVAIAEDVKHGYPEHATYLRRLATGWGTES